MLRLELTEDEAGVLRETLMSCVMDLRMEIANTDRLDFRETLKRNKQTLHAIAERLAYLETAAPPAVVEERRPAT
jgi:hypothetical protein